MQGLRLQISSEQLVGIQFLQGNTMRDVILRFVNWFWRNRRSWEWKVPTFSFTTPNSYGRNTATKCEGKKPTCGSPLGEGQVYRYIGCNTLWWTNITMENRHFSWENSLFLWPCLESASASVTPSVHFQDFGAIFRIDFDLIESSRRFLEIHPVKWVNYLEMSDGFHNYLNLSEGISTYLSIYLINLSIDINCVCMCSV